MGDLLEAHGTERPHFCDGVAGLRPMAEFVEQAGKNGESEYEFSDADSVGIENVSEEPGKEEATQDGEGQANHGFEQEAPANPAEA